MWHCRNKITRYSLEMKLISLLQHSRWLGWVENMMCWSLNDCNSTESESAYKIQGLMRQFIRCHRKVLSILFSIQHFIQTSHCVSLITSEIKRCNIFLTIHSLRWWKSWCTFEEYEIQNWKWKTLLDNFQNSIVKHEH